MRYSLLILATLSLTSAAAQAGTSLALGPTNNLRIVQKEEFCRGMNDSLIQFTRANGMTPSESQLAAGRTSGNLLQGFQEGRGTLYLDVADIDPRMKSAEGKEENYLVVANLMGRAMGIQAQTIEMVLSVSELRFIPHAQAGSEIVVVAQNGSALNPARIKSVAETAKRLNIKLNVIYIGNLAKRSKSMAQDATNLAYLAAFTGGAFADMSNTKTCGKMI